MFYPIRIIVIDILVLAVEYVRIEFLYLSAPYTENFLHYGTLNVKRSFFLIQKHIETIKSNWQILTISDTPLTNTHI